MAEPGSDFVAIGTLADYAVNILSIQVLSGPAKVEVGKLAQIVLPALGLPILVATISVLVPKK